MNERGCEPQNVRPNKVEFRLALQSEMKTLARVYRASITYVLPDLPNIHTPDEDIAFFRDRVFPENKVFVAVDNTNDTIAGFIAFTSVWINHLYLLPNYRRCGIGKCLLDLAKSETNHLYLWAFQRNQTARNFYIKFGFFEIKQTDGFDNEEKEPDVLLEWRR
jgi:putative acetyltransferase